MEGAGITKNPRASLFNEDLSNDITISRIKNLDGQNL